MSSRRAASDRADLLAALVLAADDTGVAQRLAQVLGYRAPTAAGGDHDVASLGRHRQTEILQGRQPQPARSGDAQQPSSQRAPLLAEHVGVVSVQPLAPPADAGQGANAVEPLTAARCQPRSGSAPAFVPLVPPTRLWPALKASLTVRRQGAVDVQQLVATLGRGSLPARLPRREQLLWGGGLWLVWDVAERMHPYTQDFEQLQRALILLRGAAGLCQWTVAGRPDEVLAGPSAPARRRLPRALPMPPPGTVVLLLTDLGALSDHPSAQAAWCRYADDLRRAGATPVCWAPLASRQVGVAAAQALAVHCLQPGQALRAQRGRWRTPAQRLAEQQRLAGLRDALLVRAACCVQLEPARLRALRLGSPALRGEPGVEGLLWAHRPALTTSLRSRPLTAEAAALWRPRLADLQVPDRLAVLAAMRRLHAGRGRSTEVMEALIWRAHAQLPAAALPTALAAHIEDARTWLAALAKAVDEPALPLPGLASYARDLLARQGADATWMGAQSEQLAPLWALTGAQDAPPGLAAGDMLRARQALLPRPRQSRRLLVRGHQLWLAPGDQLLPARSSWLDEARNTSAVALRLADGRQWVVDVVDVEPAEQFLLSLSGDSLPCEVGFDEAVVRLDTLQRPHWAAEWGRGKSGIYALAPPLGTLQMRFEVPDAGTSDPAQALLPAAAQQVLGRALTLPKSTHWQLGIDRPHGLFADLLADGGSQRFRWLPPGEFWMGSPDDEPERFGREGPRHRVRLSQGFWLADSACTQALWQGVMGNNPSHFKGDDQRPVEMVSFDDVTQFLARLQALLPPGCEAVLPSEAQWEYACRAGTDTPFNLPAPISRINVNFDASVASKLAVPGEESKITVPVKSLPPNAWGLYEMHGNVWEWCADDWRDYAGTALRDAALEDPWGPVSQEQGALRAVRGGSWIHHAGSLRSARRGRTPRDARFQFLGFRVALRSSPVGSAPEGPSEVLRQGPEAPGVPARRDAGPAPRAWVDRVRDLLQPGAAQTTPASGKKKPRKP